MVRASLDPVPRSVANVAEEPYVSEAIAVAAAASGHAPGAVAAGEGFESGEAVTVAATDYGTDPVAGTLVGLSDVESVVRRGDARAGTVHVHFPRFGFQIKKGTLRV